jgi:hypothetical protein
MTDFRRQISENLNYEESERRLIVIGSIFATCCLLVSTVFVIWIIRIYGKFITPGLRSMQSKTLIPNGLPSPYVLMVANTGDIIEFSFHQKKFNLDGLPNLKMLPHKPYKIELVSKELNHFGVIAGLFRQIGGHSSRFVLFCSF